MKTLSESDFRIVTDGKYFKVQIKERSGFWFWYKVNWVDYGYGSLSLSKEDAQKKIKSLMPSEWTVVE